MVGSQTLQLCIAQACVVNARMCRALASSSTLSTLRSGVLSRLTSKISPSFLCCGSSASTIFLPFFLPVLAARQRQRGVQAHWLLMKQCCMEYSLWGPLRRAPGNPHMILLVASGSAVLLSMSAPHSQVSLDSAGRVGISLVVLKLEMER